MSGLLHLFGAAWDRIRPLAAEVPSAVRAAVTNQMYPARTLLVTLAVTAAVLALAVRLIRALRK